MLQSRCFASPLASDYFCVIVLALLYCLLIRKKFIKNITHNGGFDV